MPEGTARPWFRSKLLMCHAALLAVLTAYIVVALIADANYEPDPDDGPVIGGPVILTLPLLPLGLPWSILFFALDDDAADGWFLAVGFIAALLNLVLHCAFLWRRARSAVAPS